MSRIALLFVPSSKNNYKALVLQPFSLGLLIALYLLNQSVIKSLSFIRPGVLGYSSEITIQKVLDQTNTERRKNNLPELVLNQKLSESAKAKADDMFTRDYWAHEAPDGTTPWDFFKKVDYQYLVAGENLAKDFYDTNSLMRAWMKSPTHRANIVHPRYQEIGIGVVNGNLNGINTTLVVQHFGTPMTQANLQTMTEPITPVTESAVLSNTDVEVVQQKYINPLVVSKVFGVVIFGFIIMVLFIDGYYTIKNNQRRLSGSAFGHISFLAIILMLLVFSKQGAIF